jgi:hypothetical protein
MARFAAAGTDPGKRHSTICEMTFRTAILAMRLNRKRLVVVLESELYIYDISNMVMLKTEKTSPNPNGMQRNTIPWVYVLTYASYLRLVSFFGKQLPRIPAPHQSCARHLPATLPRAAKVGPHCTN